MVGGESQEPEWQDAPSSSDEDFESIATAHSVNVVGHSSSTPVVHDVPRDSVMSEILQKQKELEQTNQTLAARFEALQAKITGDSQRQSSKTPTEASFSVVSEPTIPTVNRLQQAHQQNASASYTDNRGRVKRPVTAGLIDEPMPDVTRTDPVLQPGIQKQLMLRLPQHFGYLFTKHVFTTAESE